MRQYQEIKQQHPDALLLFRVGDFYETFGEDAVKCSKILGIVLTSRNNGGSDIELAGFPHHSKDLYLPKLVKAGYRVAVCEQLELPSKEKKIVKRGVTEVVTPGVTINDSLLNAHQNNYLSSIYFDKHGIGVAFLDISTGEFLVHQGNKASVSNLIQSFGPNEILHSKKQSTLFQENVSKEIYAYGLDEWFYEEAYNRELLLKHFNVVSLKGIGLEDLPLAQIAAGTILHYLSTIQQKNIAHIDSVNRIESDRYMWLDKFTIRNLELVSALHETGKSLFEILNHSATPMGARLLSKWIVLPLKHEAEINARLEKVAYLFGQEASRSKLIESLKKFGDLERLSSKIPLRKINPREYVVLAETLGLIEDIQDVVKSWEYNAFNDLMARIDPCKQLKSLIEQMIREDAPVNMSKGYIIKEGFNKELDDWKDLTQNSKDVLLELHKKQIEATGISSLKIGYNNVFGYYFEVTNRFKDQGLIPDDWVRKQTLKGSERYINQELKDLEAKILQAQGEISRLEAQLFEELVDKSNSYVSLLLNNARIIGQLDCLASLAEVAFTREYCKPKVDESLILDIKLGRHPVIEAQLPADQPYVPNDVFLDNESQQIIIITGPNMSGKSAVLRQTALITLLAHIGSFVPAQSAHIGIVDKIFTRVGATDNISSGESTFMVEMNETASILNNLSNRSLVILDEIGRGTSTFDGISIAWAIAEFLHNSPNYQPKTLFATHYHELSELESSMERIRNFNISTKQVGDKVIFLRKLVEGACNSSFGIHVAQIAGMPQTLISRAALLLNELESKSVHQDAAQREALTSAAQSNQQQIQLSIFDSGSEKMNELKTFFEGIDINTLTPIESMLKLKEVMEKIKGD